MKRVHAVGESDAGVPKSSNLKDRKPYIQLPVYLLVSAVISMQLCELSSQNRSRARAQTS